VFTPDPLVCSRWRPLRRSEYEHLVELGSFAGEKVELLQGRIVEMSPQGRAHAYAVTQLVRRLVPAIGDRAVVRVQMPMALSELSEPEPDLAVVAAADYLDEHPRQALLLIEVADSSLADDRKIKRRLYAEAQIPEYWIVNLLDGVVEVHREPDGGDYAQVSRHGRDALVVVPGFADVELRVGDFLPHR
jgi:Uma2 family endonuclease